MNRLRQVIFCVAVLTAAPGIQAQSPPKAIIPTPVTTTSLLVPPVKFFRQLLSASPAERISALTNRPPEARARILAKVHEYEALDPDERELRLRATELRWYLAPLFRLAPAERGPRLAQVPDDLRELVKSRLTQWDMLPPTMQKEFLDNDRALHYFAHVETTNNAAVNPDSQKISEQFNQFFELTEAEKKQTLGSLSDAERLAMEKTLQSFASLPAQQRFQCMRNYATFAGMSGAERAEFLKNAELWSKMSPKERQSWRDLVAHVPQWPPVPGAGTPPAIIPPHTAPKPLRSSVATN